MWEFLTPVQRVTRVQMGRILTTGDRERLIDDSGKRFFDRAHRHLKHIGRHGK
jgi:hypothetical protein